MRRPKFALLLFFLGFLLLFQAVHGAAAPASAPKAVLVLVDYISLQDLQDPQLTTVHRLIREGGLALVNTNTAGGRTRDNSCVTLGAGRVALGSSKAGLAFGTREEYENEPAGEIFRRRTGLVPDPDNMVHLDIARILKNNEGKPQTGVPGLLGELLHQAGRKTAVVGTADLGMVYGRQAAAVAMDRSGRVDFAFTGDELIKSDGENLLLLAADQEKMARDLKQALAKADLVVVETGDTVRLEELRDTALDKVFAESKAQALQRVDRFLAQILPMVEDYHGLLLVMASTPAQEALSQRNLVTPLIYWRKDAGAGFLTSGSTRRQGIVANTDIAPTILDFFGLSGPGEMAGRPVEIVLGGDTMASLLALNSRLVFVNKARPPLVKGYVLGQIIVVAATVLSLFISRRISRCLKPVLLALASVPLIFLIMGAFSVLSPLLYAILALGAGALITGICLATVFYHDLAPFLTVSLLTAGAILADLILGAPLMQNSVLGYDPMGGARYYGLGNEYMGVLVGSAIMGMASLMQIVRRKKIFLGCFALIFLLTIFLIASPQLGTDAGGAIAALAGFGFTVYKMMPVRVSKKQLALGIAGISFFLVTLAFWDAAQAVDAQSHFGRTINLMRTDGMAQAYNIIMRKAALNLRLIRWTVWSQVFLVTLLAMALLFYRPVGVMKRVQDRFPYLTKGFWGVVVGSIFALIFNDSGIVAAATMSIFAAAPLIFLVIQEKEKSTQTPASDR